MPTIYLGILDGYKICGKRGGMQFRKAIRPVEFRDGSIKCPQNTVPCDKSAFETPVFKDGLLEDLNHKAHFVICTENPEWCPITNFLLRFDPKSGDPPTLKYSKLASNLPILKMKMSAD